MAEIMDRIRAAAARAAAGPLSDARERPEFPRVAALSPFPPEAGAKEFLERFVAEADVVVAKPYGPFDAEGVARQVIELVSARGGGPVLSWSTEQMGVPGLDERLREASIELVPGEVPNDEGHQRTLEGYAALGIGLSGALAALADTGSIVVASGPDRARIASLLPPVHIAIVPLSRLYPTMHDWLSAVGADLPRNTANLVVITGSSRTSDIELQLTLGMHGPKELHLVLYEG